MKVQIGALLLMLILLSAGFVMPVAASTTKNINVIAATANYNTVNSFFFGMKYNEVCYVKTAGGNLNVRNGRGAIIGKLRNGTRVNVTEFIYEAEAADITAKVGRKTIRGLVAVKYLDCSA